MPTPQLTPQLQAWAVARKRFRLSHAHVQMARELGLNPKKLGKLVPSPCHEWKAPLPQFIDEIYEKRFGRSRPIAVFTVEQRAAHEAEKRAEKKARRPQREWTISGSVAAGADESDAGRESHQELSPQANPAAEQ